MLALALHSSETRKPRHQVFASVRRTSGPGGVFLCFEVQGEGVVLWPRAMGSGALVGEEFRRDDLWKKTCFE
ncbi:MAG: hypothetical protein RBT63_09955 [Bdellovibrionales bacterium]|jgi:hypothetical protein|nr:hypothetical protein [Bdellovibrionales bacterium]